MRVAHLTTSDMALGLLLLPQLRAIVDEGGEALGISSPGPWSEHLQAHGIRHLPLAHSTRTMNPIADLRAALELWRILRTEKPDVLHTHNPKPGFYGRILGRLAGVPIVINTVHGLYATENDPWLKKRTVYALEGFASRFSDQELILSDEDYQLLRRRTRRPNRLKHAASGVDLDHFDGRSSMPERVRLRREMGVHDEQVVVGIVGRLVAEKGYHEYLDAARGSRSGFAWWAIGPSDPAKKDALDAGALAEAERTGIRLLGMRDDMRNVYAAMDIFVLPSHREGLPRAAMEAAAMGLPVVATDIRGCREIVEHGTNGLLVKRGDARSLAEAIERLGADAKLREEMGRAGAALARERFDERVAVREVLKTYDEIAARKGLISASRARARPGGPVKRVLDIVLAGAALFLTLPILLVVTVLTFVSLGPPVIFRQSRAGLGGRRFDIYKFRTMRDLHDDEGNLRPDEDRLTRVGRILRRFSLDELPELFNVLRGEMSLVGPRPLLADYLSLYSPDQSRRHDVKPGVTGWAQIHGRNERSWDERFALDVWYVDNRSHALDMKILALTLRRVLSGAGINRTGHATMPRFTGSTDEEGGNSSHAR